MVGKRKVIQRGLNGNTRIRVKWVKAIDYKNADGQNYVDEYYNYVVARVWINGRLIDERDYELVADLTGMSVFEFFAKFNENYEGCVDDIRYGVKQRPAEKICDQVQEEGI